MSASLKWVRWDASIFTSAKWLSTPMDERGVWSHLILLAAKNLGSFEGTAEQIAVVMRCEPELVQRTLERFKGYGALKRRKADWVVVNFAEYNPGAKYLSHEQRAATRAGGDRHPEGGGQVATNERTDETNVRIAATLDALYEAKGWIPQEGDEDRLAQLMADFPRVDILEEAKKAAAWTVTGREVKNGWLFFRKWLARAPIQAIQRDESPDQIRARLARGA